MYRSRDRSYTHQVTDHALITWLSCTIHVADHTKITCLVIRKLLDHALRARWEGWGVTPRTLRGFALELGERGLDPASQARVLSTARAFFRWLFETGRVRANPASGLRNPKQAKKLPAFLTEGESSALLDLPPAVDFP